MTFENIVAKGEIAHDEQFHLLQRYFQLTLEFILTVIDYFHIFVQIISKMSAAEFVYCMWERTKY